VDPIWIFTKKEPTMTKRKRRHYDVNLKSRVALEAIKELKTLDELSSEFGVHANQIRSWKKEFLEKASLVFSENKDAKRLLKTFRRSETVCINESDNRTWTSTF